MLAPPQNASAQYHSNIVDYFTLKMVVDGFFLPETTDTPLVSVDTQAPACKRLQIIVYSDLQISGINCRAEYDEFSKEVSITVAVKSPGDRKPDKMFLGSYELNRAWTDAERICVRFWDGKSVLLHLEPPDTEDTPANEEEPTETAISRFVFPAGNVAELPLLTAEWKSSTLTVDFLLPLSESAQQPDYKVLPFQGGSVLPILICHNHQAGVLGYKLFRGSYACEVPPGTDEVSVFVYFYEETDGTDGRDHPKTKRGTYVAVRRVGL